MADNMKKDLRDYVKIYKNIISQETCIKAVQELDNANWMSHSYYNSKIDDMYTHEKDLTVCYDRIFPIHDDVMKATWDSLKKYIIDDLQFSWFESWDGYMTPRYNRYSPGTLMNMHCDHIKSLFQDKKGIPILSVVGCFNNDYEGGKFIMFDNIEYNIEAGDVIIFPSNFLYPHRVSEVTSGTRYSYVSWVW
jgi:predicted 2-oxoglutarate/Fe(II)-dependent dioxygenase YbiX